VIATTGDKKRARTDRVAGGKEHTMTKAWELLDHLEKDQDDLEAQREALWPKYAAFRKGLFQALHEFCAEAQKRGLTGIEEPIRVVSLGADFPG
jgi:hypothetical protein